MMRPLPELAPDVAFFWESGADGVLRILHCAECEFWVHPPGPVCPRCLSRAIEPRELSGRAIVETFTINRQRWRPDLEVPYVIAIVELPEQTGLRLTTNIVACDVADVEVGMRVEVLFEQHDDVWLPLFRPASGDW